MEVDCPSENQAKIKEGQVALDRVSQCGCCHKIGEAKAKILGLSCTEQIGMRLASPRLGTLAHRLYSFYFIYFPTCGFV